MLTTCTFKLKSLSTYSPSRRIEHLIPKLEKEKPDAYEKRVWREKAHWTPKGEFFIPAIQFLKAIQSTASYLSENVPGKGKATWTKHFRAGITCLDPYGIIIPGVTHENVQCNSYLCDVGGGKGGKGGAQVMRTFPEVSEWEGSLQIAIIDKMIEPELLSRYLSECGLLNGVGRYRPQSGGTNGRFEVLKMTVANK